MTKPKKSRRWIQEHLSDHYVKQAQQSGYRSRAAYKLLDIQAKYKIMRAGMTVIDLGSAPGGWSQVAAKIIGPTGKVIAIDLLSMQPIPNVTFILGDFTLQTTLDQIHQVLGDAYDKIAASCDCVTRNDADQLATKLILERRRVDLIISDMAPNLSGIKVTDQARSLYLAECALNLVKQTLRNGGDFLIKLFYGAGIPEFQKQVAKVFEAINIYKPPASKSTSAEFYLLARKYKG